MASRCPARCRDTPGSLPVPGPGRAEGGSSAALARLSLRGGTSNPPPEAPAPLNLLCARLRRRESGFLCGFCVIEACWQECRSVSSRGQQKHLVREKIIGVSGVCVSDRAAPPPRSAVCVCRDPGESRGESGAGRCRAVPSRCGRARGKPERPPGQGGLPGAPQDGPGDQTPQRRPTRHFRVPRRCPEL